MDRTTESLSPDEAAAVAGRAGAAPVVAPADDDDEDFVPAEQVW